MMAALSGYRIMWMLVMFDLPVLTAQERREATRFRNHLKNLGFEMSQLSVYLRWCGSRERVKALAGQVQQGLPQGGEVRILTFTDRQYEDIISFQGKKREKKKVKMRQLTLL